MSTANQALTESFTLASAYLRDEPEVMADEDKAAVPVIDRTCQRVDGLDVLHAQEHTALTRWVLCTRG